MDFELRATEPSDYDTIATWIQDAVSCSRWAGPLVPFPFSARELPELLSAKGGSSYSLAAGNNRCIGFGQFWVIRQRSVHLGRIIISPEARGVGTGRLLCKKLIAKAIQETDAARVTLRVYRDNAPALSLYSSLGFAIIESESTDKLLLLLMSASNAE